METLNQAQLKPGEDCVDRGALGLSHPSCQDDQGAGVLVEREPES